MLPIQTLPPENEMQVLAAKLRGALESARKVSTVTLADSAVETWCEIYTELDRDAQDDSLSVAQFLSRAAPQVLRMAMVLGHGKNSVFPVLRRLVRFGLGGQMGNGGQFVSWIHESDYCRAVEWLLTHDDLHGVVNLAAPKPLPNREMMATLRQICRVPFGLPATHWMLEMGAYFLRTETELIIKSRRVVPRRLLESGFQFQFPTIREAFESLSANGEQRIETGKGI